MAHRRSRELDYLVIGHVTRDLLPDGEFAIGGTATYAARTAQAVGCRVGVITSADVQLELEAALPHVALLRIPASTTTTFENRITRSGRVQMVQTVARCLMLKDVPMDWRQAGIVHLGPVVQECDPALALAFGDSFLGLTPQGWMRRWNCHGRIYSAPWTSADRLLPHADAVVLSEEDLAGDEGIVARWATMTPVLVLTRGARGCTVFAEGEVRDVPGFPAAETDPTGAGDIFAAIFFTALAQGLEPWESAQLANAVAAISVTRAGLGSIPTPAELLGCRARLRNWTSSRQRCQ
ncbi:MAG: PfkB family carbohydrate kinase [Anaerolineae bacterium]|jgi:sugar/nucleoside kinase (ribokinase family)